MCKVTQLYFIYLVYKFSFSIHNFLYFPINLFSLFDYTTLLKLNMFLTRVLNVFITNFITQLCNPFYRTTSNTQFIHNCKDKL